MGKQMEGDNEQRRARAADAREEGRRPSEDGVTTGASGQQRSLGNQADHAEKMAGPGWGKQQPDRAAPDPRPGSIPTPGPVQNDPDTMPPRGTSPRAEPGNLSEEDQRVFSTLARLESEGDPAPTATAIAREAGLSTEDAIPVLQRLMDDHDVVQELPAEPELGRRYRVKTRV